MTVGADLDPVAVDFAGGAGSGPFGEGGDGPGLRRGGGAHVDAAGGVDGGVILGWPAWLSGGTGLSGLSVFDGLGGWDVAGEVGAVCPAGVTVGADLDPVAVDFAGDLDACAAGKLVDNLPGRRGGSAHVEPAGGVCGGVVKGWTPLAAAGRRIVLGARLRLGGGRRCFPSGEVASVNPSGLAVDGDRDPTAVGTSGDLHLLTALGNGEDLACTSRVATDVNRNSGDHGVGKGIGTKVHREDVLLGEESLVDPAGGAIDGDGDPPAHLLSGDLHRLASCYDSEHLAGVGGGRPHVDVRGRIHRLRICCVRNRANNGRCNNADPGGEGDGGGSTSD